MHPSQPLAALRLDREPRMNIDARLLEIIRCPNCRGGLAPTGEELVCGECGYAYPVRDDIPILLVDEARRPG